MFSSGDTVRFWDYGNYQNDISMLDESPKPFCSEFADDWIRFSGEFPWTAELQVAMERFFGYKEFRSLQLPILNVIISKEDCVGV